MFKHFSEILLGLILVFVIFIAYKSMMKCNNIESFGSICVNKTKRQNCKRFDDKNCPGKCASLHEISRTYFKQLRKYCDNKMAREIALELQNSTELVREKMLHCLNTYTPDNGKTCFEALKNGNL
jgi:hypothetical protein